MFSQISKGREFSSIHDNQSGASSVLFFSKSEESRVQKEFEEQMRRERIIQVREQEKECQKASVEKFKSQQQKKKEQDEAQRKYQEYLGMKGRIEELQRQKVVEEERCG